MFTGAESGVFAFSTIRMLWQTFFPFTVAIISVIPPATISI